MDRLLRFAREIQRAETFEDLLTTTVAPVVVIDARTDPRTNKAIAEALGNHTIVNGDALLHVAEGAVTRRRAARMR